MSRLSLCCLVVAVGCSPPPPPAAIPEAVEVPMVSDVRIEPTQPEPVVPDVNSGGTPSGLSWTILRQGDGQTRPGLNDSVKVHYRGWTSDGAEFDSSYKRNSPATFGVQKVIKGWTETLQHMVVGDHWRVVIPAALAYGEQPKRSNAPAGVLTFEIELLEVIEAPPVPEDVAAPPPSAKVTATGLAYRVLRRGVGRTHPTPSDRVEVHYTGWTTDGVMFDSSVTRGKSATFSVNGVIKGWTEGLQLMVAGDVFRLWIPANLAYGNSPRAGAPKGMLVFDVELLRVVP